MTDYLILKSSYSCFCWSIGQVESICWMD